MPALRDYSTSTAQSTRVEPLTSRLNILNFQVQAWKARLAILRRDLKTPGTWRRRRNIQRVMENLEANIQEDIAEAKPLLAEYRRIEQETHEAAQPVSSGLITNIFSIGRIQPAMPFGHSR